MDTRYNLGQIYNSQTTMALFMLTPMIQLRVYLPYSSIELDMQPAILSTPLSSSINYTRGLGFK